MKGFAYLLAAATLLTTILAQDAAISPTKVEADIKVDQLRKNLEDLYKIAQDNGGNRAAGLPGFKASVDYVLSRTRDAFPADSLTVWTQTFNFSFETTHAISITGPDGEKVKGVISLDFNHPTPLPGGIKADLIDTPVDDEKGSACFEEQWKGINATGKMALVKRGICAISDKLKLARAHGALGVILWNQTPNVTVIPGATLGDENIGQLIPVGVVPFEVGSKWKGDLAAGKAVTATLMVDSEFGIKDAWNVFAETAEGSPDSVIMLGAHLDSVQAGPGINDDGTGSSALLEILGSVMKYKGFPNKIRFAWWGAEESGLIGSIFYTQNLTEEQVGRIKYYFNYDMIGSIQTEYFVLGTNGTTASGEPLSDLADYIRLKGKEPVFDEIGQRSDHVGFLQRGIPAASLFTGAGEPWDPCYHQACDDLTNVDWEALELNAKAAGHVLAKYALSLDGVPARQAKTSPASAGGAGAASPAALGVGKAPAAAGLVVERDAAHEDHHHHHRRGRGQKPSCSKHERT